MSEKKTSKSKTPLTLEDIAKKLTIFAQKRGYVTIDEINSVLPANLSSGDAVDKIMAILQDAWIHIATCTRC